MCYCNTQDADSHPISLPLTSQVVIHRIDFVWTTMSRDAFIVTLVWHIKHDIVMKYNFININV